MSVRNAKKFIEYLEENPEVMEKMKDFTMEELKQAAEEKKKEEGNTLPQSHFPI